MGYAVAGGFVPFDDYAGKSPVINFTRDSRDATRIGIVAWANIDALTLECFPPPPAPPGQFPGVSYLYVESMDVRPLHPEGSLDWNPSGDFPTYDSAEVTIKYSKLKFEQPSANQLISRKWAFSAEFMTIPSNTLQWLTADANGKKDVKDDNITAGKLIPMVEHSITWHRALSVPWTAIKANIGKVNDGTLNNSYFNSVADQSLLYLGAEIGWTFSSDGTQVWTIDHKFQERKLKSSGSSYGWNHFWKTSNNSWDKLVDKNDASKFVYDTSSSFMDLFS